VKTPGDAKAGRLVFNKVCGQCHKMHGEGQEVGPDITVNGRASFEQLLSNVFDPSLVIGADYQAVTVSTTKGRVLTGLLVEDSKERVSLKVQGGKLEIVPRAEVEEIQRSKVSLMPEGLEKQIPSNEIRDLFAYLLLDKPPEDSKAKKIPGAP
jgi:putative heme-binding domain-containing protein